jgi:hypothetical protein
VEWNKQLDIEAASTALKSFRPNFVSQSDPSAELTVHKVRPFFAYADTV